MMKKTAIITGAGRGIGYAIAQKLGQQGFALVLTGRSTSEQYAEALAQLQAEGIQFCYVQADVSQQEDRQKTLQAALAAYGRVDVLVNNAGVAPAQRADLLEMTEESFDRVVGINTKGNLFFTQLVAKQMLNQPLTEEHCRGIIINISSCSAQVSSVNRGEYCVSKAGVAMLTQLFADRLAGEDILVHEIRPGIIDTDMTGTVHEKYNNLIENGVFPLARWGTAQDVAEVAAALCAPGAFRYTTGDVIDVDGGFHIRRL